MGSKANVANIDVLGNYNICQSPTNPTEIVSVSADSSCPEGMNKTVEIRMVYDSPYDVLPHFSLTFPFGSKPPLSRTAEDYTQSIDPAPKTDVPKTDDATVKEKE